MYLYTIQQLYSCDYLIELILLLLLSELGNARVILEAVLLIETIAPITTRPTAQLIVISTS